MCQRHNRAINDLGFSSAFLRIGQVSHPKVFLGEGVEFVFMISPYVSELGVRVLTLVILTPRMNLDL